MRRDISIAVAVGAVVVALAACGGSDARIADLESQIAELSESIQMMPERTIFVGSAPICLPLALPSSGTTPLSGTTP